MISPYRPFNIQRITNIKIKIVSSRKIKKDNKKINKLKRICYKIKYLY